MLIHAGIFHKRVRRFLSACHPLGQILQNNSVLLFSWPCNGSLNTASRETFLSESSYVLVVFSEWHWGVIVTLDHISSIAKLKPWLSRFFQQALKLSPHLSGTGTGCFRTAATSVSFCVFRLEFSWNWISESPGHTVQNTVGIYQPLVDVLKCSEQPTAQSILLFFFLGVC